MVDQSLNTSPNPRPNSPDSPAPTCHREGHLEEVVAQLEAQGIPPWAPDRREDQARMARMAAQPERIWCLSEVDIFADLNAAEMDAMAAAAPMRSYHAGALVFTPQQPMEALFILKKGRVRIFRVSADGRALTTAIISPGTIFGEMIIVGQQMHDQFAEALDDAVVCVMGKSDVRRLLLGDPRIAVRISETLGERLAVLEQRLTDVVFKSVPQRLASTLCVMAIPRGKGRPFGRAATLSLTHEQLATLAGTSRETTTKVLGEFADQGLIELGRGKITVLDRDALSDFADA